MHGLLIGIEGLFKAEIVFDIDLNVYIMFFWGILNGSKYCHANVCTQRKIRTGCKHAINLSFTPLLPPFYPPCHPQCHPVNCYSHWFGQGGHCDICPA